MGMGMQTASGLTLLHEVHAMPAWKRAMDAAGAALGLLLLAPLMLLIAVAIKAVSRGPALYRHTRLGLHGAPFACWKFRTMPHGHDTQAHAAHMAALIHGSHDAPMRKLDACTPIIPLGHLLRRSCLDELPQLINVLRGEMSLVGPRPPMPYEAAHYAPWHRARLEAVPGMTGLWQVSGKNELSFDEMATLDIHYAQHLGLALDCAILLRTPEVVVRQLLRLPMRPMARIALEPRREEAP